MENHNYCNNCGKTGHMYNQCKMPITSIGVIVYRINNNNLEYLMIRRKETLGFIDFIRGKYSLQNKDYILNMFKQMTINEKKSLLSSDFDILWKNTWCNLANSLQYKIEQNTSKEKFITLKDGVLNKDEYYTLESIIEDSKEFQEFTEPEWGFPKGRRNIYEKDYDCAIREFCEETGYSKDNIFNIQNVMPFYEIFTGSNYKSYRHKYFLMFMKRSETNNMDNFQISEVSKMNWVTLDESLKLIRPYNLEKKNIIKNVDKCLKNLQVYIL